MSTILASCYVAASMFVGVSQIVDAAILASGKGVVTKALIRFSLFEYAWAGVSITVFFLAASIPWWLPASFVGYVAALYIAARALPPTRRGPTASFVIPRAFVMLGGVFGVYFSAASAWVWLAN
jgi:hypothetical protein